MVTVTIANAGINNFNLPSLLMDALVGKTAETFISSDKVRLYSNKGDYIELTGKFDFSEGTTGNPVDNIVRIANYKVFVDKKIAYEINGLELTRGLLKSLSKFNGYLNSVDITFKGNEDANSISGTRGDNRLFGSGGNDVLLGGDRNDLLSGGVGKDLLNGGRGDDTFLISDDTDKIVEAAKGGTDWIRSSISFDLGNVKNVENLILTGKADLSASGNNLDNQIEGNGGDNLLVAGRGKDRLTGGSGNDTYVMDAADLVFENADGGNDLVKSGDRIDLTRLLNVENAMLIGSANVDVTGNDKKNVLTGNDGKNDISGAGGNDILTGGAGADNFVFSMGDGRDFISDFVAGGKGQDLIDLSEFGSNLRLSDLAIKQVGQNTEINFSKGDVLVLRDVDAHEIGKADFIF